MFQMQIKTLHAAVPPTEKSRQIAGEPTQREQQRLMGQDIEIQLDAHVKAVRRLVKRQDQRPISH